MEEVKRAFKPEFLNRIDETIVFHSLTKDTLRQIAGLQLDLIVKRCKEQLNIKLLLQDSVTEYILEKGFDTIRFLHNGAYEAEDLIIAGSRGWACEASPSAEDRKIIAREAIRFDLSLCEAEKLRGDSMREIVAYSHYPVLSPGEDSSPILEVLVKHGIKRLYYGHLHGVKEERLIKKAGGIDLTLVSADYRMFTPVRIN